MRWMAGIVAFGMVAGGGSAHVGAADREWVDLTAPDLGAWQTPTGDWQVVASVALDPKDPKRLVSGPGTGVIVNGPTGKTRNLLSKEKFGDVDTHLEFFIPKGSNSGVKFAGLYEVQICDSADVKEATATHCGGIYPRAELLPTYHYLDKGHPPLVNAAKPAGEWQTLDVTFLAPRFDADGKKTANAKIVKAVLNGQVIHEDLELAAPTGHFWKNKEVAAGPLLLQADHGPVAFRNVRIRPPGGEGR